MTIVNAQHIRKSYESSGRVSLVLDDISLVVRRGEFVSFFGPNGCGKSTLMNIIAGLEQPDSGSVSVETVRRRQIPIVFQDYRRSLLPWLDVEANVTFPLRIAGIPRDEIASRFREFWRFAPRSLSPSARVTSLSGGEAQQVCLLRALFSDPEIVVCDEPFSAIDYQAAVFLRQQLMDISTELGITILYVSHNLDDALYVGDRVVFLSSRPAKIVEIVDVTFPRPRHVSLQASLEFFQLKAEAFEIFSRSTTPLQDNDRS
jgi:NitT/TauT family transport system ATP-binding protein